MWGILNITFVLFVVSVSFDLSGGLKHLFLYNFMENISVLPKWNVFFNNKSLILIWFFLLIDNEYDIKIPFRVIQKITKYSNANSQNFVIFKISFKIDIVFSINRKSSVLSKRINFLFIAVIFFPLSSQMIILTIYNNRKF